MPGEVAQVLAHLGRTGGAVEADHLHAERLERGERGTDLGSEQHGSGRLDRDLDPHRHVGVSSGDGTLGADDRGLGLQQVLRGLDQHGVDAAVDHAGDLLLVRVAKRGEWGVAERRQFAPGPTSRSPSVADLA